MHNLYWLMWIFDALEHWPYVLAAVGVVGGVWLLRRRKVKV